MARSKVVIPETVGTGLYILTKQHFNWVWEQHMCGCEKRLNGEIGMLMEDVGLARLEHSPICFLTLSGGCFDIGGSPTGPGRTSCGNRK